jgi:hypothetical protein
MTAEDYTRARKLAEQIAESFAAPRFYSDFRTERDISFRMLHADPLLERSRQIIIAREEHFGHGLRHSEKVAVDAGAIVQNEVAREGMSPQGIQRMMLLVQLASMLHDVQRRMPDHAREGALAAAAILADFPLQDNERDSIVQAIRNHEAFIEATPLENFEGQLLSDALYDADKFRWGPDNFTETLWNMISGDIPIRSVIAHFPKGMKGIQRIADTFRSKTGKEYGPEFIELGLNIGWKLYVELEKQFPVEKSG